MSQWKHIPFPQAIETLPVKNKIKSSAILTTGQTPVIDQSEKLIAGFTDLSALYTDPPYIIFGDHTRCIKYVDFCFNPGADGVKILKVNNEHFDPRFVCEYLKFRPVQNLGYSRHFKLLKEITIPAPRLEEQRRIARILNTPSHVKALIEKRIQLLDVLVSTIIKNYYSNAYPTVKVGKIARVATGATPSRKNKEFFNGNIPWVKTGEVLNNRLSETEEHISAQALKETSCDLLPTGSTLVAMYGQGKTRGRVAILEKPMATNQACAAVIPFDKSDSEYLFQILRFNYHELRSAGRGGTQPNLNLDIVKNFQIPYPQNSVERAQLIRPCLEIDSQKSKLESQLQKFEELHQSLVTRAFAGQL